MEQLRLLLYDTAQLSTWRGEMEDGLLAYITAIGALIAAVASTAGVILSLHDRYKVKQQAKNNNATGILALSTWQEIAQVSWWRQLFFEVGSFCSRKRKMILLVDTDERELWRHYGLNMFRPKPKRLPDRQKNESLEAGKQFTFTAKNAKEIKSNTRLFKIGGIEGTDHLYLPFFIHDIDDPLAKIAKYKDGES